MEMPTQDELFKENRILKNKLKYLKDWLNEYVLLLENMKDDLNDIGLAKLELTRAILQKIKDVEKENNNE